MGENGGEWQGAGGTGGVGGNREKSGATGPGRPRNLGTVAGLARLANLLL